MTEETATENLTATTEPAKEITMKTNYWSTYQVPFRVIRTTDDIKEDT